MSILVTNKKYKDMATKCLTDIITNTNKLLLVNTYQECSQAWVYEFFIAILHTCLKWYETAKMTYIHVNG